MKKQLLMILVAMLAIWQSAFAYTSAVAPSGQTLYYDIVDGHAKVVRPGSGSGYNNYVTGNLVIPASVTYNGTTYPVTSIGYEAFYGCSGLTSVTIPNSVTSIGNYAFESCSGLTSTIYTGTIAQWCSISFGGSFANPLRYSHSLTIGGSEITNLVIPNGVTEIKQDAFLGCTGLTSVTIPNSVTSIGNGAFSNCTGLTSTIYTGTIAQWCSISFGGSGANPLYYSHSLTIGGSEITNLVIPNGVTEIKQYAFYGCSGLTSVTIPNSVTSIGSYAFEDCSGLTSVTIPNSVTSIGERSFYGCSGLTSVTIPNSVTSIGNHAFYGCTGLTSVTIGNSVTSIGNYAFRGCTGLTSVTIPNSVTSIGNGAFYGCTGLTSVTIPNSVTSIGSDAFSYVRHIEYYGSATGGRWGALYMNGVTDADFIFSDATKHYLIVFIGTGGNVSIPSTVDAIGQRAFQYCTGLTSVTIGNSVTIIGSSAFGGCTSLTEIVSHSTVAPTLGSDVFLNVPTSIDVHIPCGSVASYFSRWSYFNGFIEAAGNTFEAASADTDMGTVNIITAPTCEAPTAAIYAAAATGYRFDHWGDGNTDNPRTITLTSDSVVVGYFAPMSGLSDTIVVHDTIYLPVHDTTVVRDTIYLPVYVHDTSYVDVHDTTYIPIHDTTTVYLRDTLITNSYTFDTTIYNHFQYDTTLVFDTMIVNVYSYDTSIYNNYQYDTVILNYYQYDTTLVNIYDTTIVNIYDTVIYNNYQYDTVIVNNYVYDTVIVNHYYYDTTIINNYDTVNNYYHDTVNNYYYDTVIITHNYHDTVIVNNYIYDTIYLNRYIFDTVYIHDTIYITPEGIDGAEVLNAKIYQRNGQVVVEGADGNRVTLYDINGRVLATKQDDYTTLHFDTPVSGTYMIKIGRYPARKVVVIR